MTSKYFTVEKKLTVAASFQHAGTFGTNTIVADWTALQIPRGASMLKSVVALVRAKGDAGPTDNRHPFDLVFSKTNTVSLGTIRTVMQHRPSNDYLGMISIDQNNYGGAHFDSTAIATLGGDTDNSCPPLVLQGDISTGDNVGYDTIYVAMISQDASLDFSSINTVNETGFSAGAQTVITMDDGSAGTSMDCREHFVAGDILHAQDDAVLGTLASAAAQQITLTAANTDAIAENDVIYNINPVKLILGFER